MMLKSSILFAGAFTAALCLSQASHAAIRIRATGMRFCRKPRARRSISMPGAGPKTSNSYIDWAGQTLKERFGVTVVHVKLDDTANAVATVLAEKAAGKSEGGSVDLIWINGENFASMKRQDLLMAPDWTTSLPNWAYVDHETKPTILTEFTIPTDGLESPWGGAKMVFFHDTARTPADSVPRSSAELLDWAERNPGRFSYPQPPDFIGSSFLKQVLLETIEDPAKLSQPVDEASFTEDAAPLFAYLDRLHPNLWRSGKAYPQNYPDMKQKLADGELDIIFAFNPSEASAGIAAGELPDTVRSFTYTEGTLGNTHFCRHSLQCRRQGRRAGAGRLPDFAGGAAAQAGPFGLGRPDCAVDGQALGRGPRCLRGARSGRCHAQAR